jgi:hypothetical protein
LNFHIYNETWISHSLNLHFSSFYAHFYQSCQKLHENNIIYTLYYFCCMYQFLNYTLKLGISWPFAVILNTFNWKSGKKIDFLS